MFGRDMAPSKVKVDLMERIHVVGYWPCDLFEDVERETTWTFMCVNIYVLKF